jgi:HAMP domain-containing protein
MSGKLTSAAAANGKKTRSIAARAPSWGNAKGDADSLSKTQVLRALRALSRGESTVALPEDLVGVDAQLATVIQLLATNQHSFEKDLADLSLLVGSEGRTMRRLTQSGTKTSWSRCAASVNDLLDDLTAHTDEMARVISAVSRGDLSQRLDPASNDAHLHGDFLKHAAAVNGMVDQLSLLGSELTRVTREFGLDGKLGAQAHIPGASGAWKELADGVNLMSSHLTAQVREIARVTTAVAQGDLTKTVTIEVRGELLELKNTI